MKCPRCGRRMGAGWYCANCGQALPDINVADRPGGRGGRRLALAAAGLVGLSLAGLALWAARPPPPPAPTPPASPPPSVVAGAPTALPAALLARARRTPRIVTPTPSGGAAAGPGPGPAAAPTATLAPGQPVWPIPYLAEQPRLDGVLDEWRQPPVSLAAVVFGGESWEGPLDLSALAVAGYDRELLFLGVRVLDETLSQPARGERLFLGDSLELQLDADRHGDASTATYNADDFQLGLSPGDFAGRPAEAYLWRPVARSLPEAVVVARRLGDGYVLEAALPWRLFGVDPEHRPSLGIALNASDNDLAEPAQLTMVSSTPNRSWSDPRRLGTLVLMPVGEVAPPPVAPQGPTPRQGPPP